MAESDDLADFFFDLYITAAGPYWGMPFRIAAEDAIAEWAYLRHLPGPDQGWVLATMMVRTGLLFCERRDPGHYHGFLAALAPALTNELEWIVDGGGEWPGCHKWKDNFEFESEDNLFYELGERVLRDRVVDQPRAVAFALIREGLQLCEDLAPDRYGIFVMSVRVLLDNETGRSKDWTRLLPPGRRSQGRATLRLLPCHFNRHANPPATQH